MLYVTLVINFNVIDRDYFISENYIKRKPLFFVPDSVCLFHTSIMDSRLICWLKKLLVAVSRQQLSLCNNQAVGKTWYEPRHFENVILIFASSESSTKDKIYHAMLVRVIRGTKILAELNQKNVIHGQTRHEKQTNRTQNIKYLK